MPLPTVTRRSALKWMAAQTAVASAARGLTQSAKKQPPNVIFLLADDVGYGDLACLGNPVIKTPNLDAMHAECVRFTDFHVSPTCSPTRASLMTGRYNNATGVWHTIMGRSLLDPSNVCMAECFQSSGYATGIFGKWHLGDNYPCRPMDFHFDESVVVGGGGVAQTPDYFNNDDRDDAYLHNGTFEKYLGFSTNIFFDRAMDFMAHAQRRDQPFFCYLPTPAAHAPTWALASDTAPYVGVPGLSNPGFYGMIANIDANLGRLRQFLEARGLAENTILMYAGDNGGWDGVEVYNAGMRGKKGSPYEGGHRVPFFIYWKGGGVTGGRDVSTLSAHIDVLPTMVELCGLNNHGYRVDGRSLRPLLYGKDSEWQARTLFTDSQREENLIKWKHTAVMTQQWRLVNPTDNGDESRIELYDIQADPGQKSNIAADHPDIVRNLKAEYEGWWKDVSADGNRYVRIVLGNHHENPSRLNCMDWHGDQNGSTLVWNQHQIRTAPIANGFWAVRIAQAGRYRFELRRWPTELDLAIDAPYVDLIPNMESAPGRAIQVGLARLAIGAISRKSAVQAGDKFAAFEVTLPAGPAELRATFESPGGESRGAYYVYAERL